MTCHPYKARQNILSKPNRVITWLKKKINILQKTQKFQDLESKQPNSQDIWVTMYTRHIKSLENMTNPQRKRQSPNVNLEKTQMLELSKYLKHQLYLWSMKLRKKHLKWLGRYSQQRNKKYTKKNHMENLELKTTTFQMKKLPSGLNSRLEMTEDRTSN